METKPKVRRRSKPEKTIEEIKRQEYLTVPDVARLGSFTKPQAYGFVKEGILPATRVPGRPNTLRVKRTDFEKLMEENRVKKPKKLKKKPKKLKLAD